MFERFLNLMRRFIRWWTFPRLNRFTLAAASLIGSGLAFAVAFDIGPPSAPTVSQLTEREKQKAEEFNHTDGFFWKSRDEVLKLCSLLMENGNQNAADRLYRELQDRPSISTYGSNIDQLLNVQTSNISDATELACRGMLQTQGLWIVASHWRAGESDYNLAKAVEEIENDPNTMYFDGEKIIAQDSSRNSVNNLGIKLTETQSDFFVKAGLATFSIRGSIYNLQKAGQELDRLKHQVDKDSRQKNNSITQEQLRRIQAVVEQFDREAERVPRYALRFVEDFKNTYSQLDGTFITIEEARKAARGTK